MNCHISITTLKESLTASLSSTSSLSDDDSSSEAAFLDTPFLAKADIYGQVHPIESSGLLAKRLDEFDDQLDQSLREGSALNAAIEKCPTLCRQESFRLLFLRAECFRVKVRGVTPKSLSSFSQR